MANTFGSASSPANFANTGLQVGGNQILPVVQIVQGTTTSATTTTNTSFTDTNLTVTITPKFNTSKILLHITGMLDIASATVGQKGIATVARGGTDLSGGGGFATVLTNVSGQLNAVGCAFSFYDSPATTSATTYTVRIRTNSGTGTTGFMNDTTNGTGVILAIEYAQ